MQLILSSIKRLNLRFQKPPAWTGLLIAILLLAQSYVFMEWVFFVTKPSFLDLFSTGDKVMVLFQSANLVALFGLCAQGGVYLITRILRLQRHTRLSLWVSISVPTLILACLALIMIDNFTYTLFSFGIATSTGVGQVLYGVLFLVLVFWSATQVVGISETLHTWYLNRKRRSWVWGCVAAWLLMGLSMLVIQMGVQGKYDLGLSPSKETLTLHPHILWITGDGLSIDHLSLYGYERDTTPHMRSLASQSLVAEHAFANSANSTGSIVSMLTGKTPLETRVLFSPDILHGQDAYQHLPGILRTQGYYTIQYGYPYYVDASVVNMLDGFDLVNEQSLEGGLLRSEVSKYLPEALVYFLSEIGTRIGDRLQHVSFINTMRNPNEIVLSKVKQVDDRDRMNYLLDRLSNLDQPTFIHIHLMGTHGPQFQPSQQVYSLGKDIRHQLDWDMDLYDDAVLEFDRNIGLIIDKLKEYGLLENTLLIIGSDHGIYYDQLKIVPMVIRFPGGENIGWIKGNVQSIDIAPTILDYLDISQPIWMQGQSIIDNGIDKTYIFGVKVAYLETNNKNRFKINLSQVHPPFYQVGKVSVIDCSRFYELDLVELSLVGGDVQYYKEPCYTHEVFSAQQAYDLLLDHLGENGYEVSSLENYSAEDLLVEP